MKAIAEKIYQHLPIKLQNLMITGYGYLLKKQRYGRYYIKSYNKYFTKDYSNLESEKSLQNDMLIDFVQYAYQNSPYYRKLYAGIDIDNFNGMSDLKALPILSKENLRENIESVYTIDSNKGIKAFTGGTTGKALEVVFTKADCKERNAYLDAFKAKLGINPFNTSKATFSGREFIKNTDENTEVFWRYNKAYKQKLYSTFHLNKKTLPLYIRDLNEFQPDVINGFVSAIYEVAQFIKTQKIELSFVPKAIFTTSETLLPFHRELIQEVFRCRVYNQYASAEGAPFVTECKKGNLHYNLDTGVIELDENDSILVTSFTTHGTPLIRYAIGDEISFKDGDCECGSAHPLVEEIKGRMVDHLLALNGTKVSLSHLADVIKGMPSSVKNVQFNQVSNSKVIVNLVTDDKIYKLSHDKLIIDSLKFRFGNSMNIELNKVADIKREKSGKFALIKKYK
jgi:phenylacetate-CoA ligase